MRYVESNTEIFIFFDQLAGNGSRIQCATAMRFMINRDATALCEFRRKRNELKLLIGCEKVARGMTVDVDRFALRNVVQCRFELLLILFEIRFATSPQECKF